MRIQGQQPQLTDVERGLSCQIMIDGRQFEAYIGETVATVLMAYGRFPSTAMSPDQPGLAGFFCGIGHCYGCQVIVNDRPVRACLTPIHPNMVVLTSLEPPT